MVSTAFNKEINPRIVAIGTANPPNAYTQQEVIDYYQETNPKIIRLFKNSHIKQRYLYLPKKENGIPQQESNQELIDKHTQGALTLGMEAITKCLTTTGLAVTDIDYLCCVSSTGYLCPGISAKLIKEMGFRPDCQRVDILGMGCNAGMNALQPVTNFTRANPGKNALLVCVEICSAAYVNNDSLVTAVVNSLFGDGVAAILVKNELEPGNWQKGPVIRDFESHIITDAIHTMRFDLENDKLSFFLDRDIPYVLGLNIEKPIQRLLERHQLHIRDIRHWIIHPGGKKVINAIKYNLGLTDYDVRHTLHVLNNYGNLSSCSFLFAYQQLYEEQVTDQHDLGIAIAMGPGASIEAALLEWV
ncbi:MAG: 3,5-dihydroxyphenylacetyl-CoA synthase DpgA [Flammeovirgaceae bacterium]